MKLPTIDDGLQEDVILNKGIRTSRWGDVGFIQVGLKGVHPRKARDWESEGTLPSLHF